MQFGNSFLQVGGWNNGSNFDRIFKFDEIDYKWIELEKKLDKPRGVFNAFLVPDEAVNCY